MNKDVKFLGDIKAINSNKKEYSINGRFETVETFISGEISRATTAEAGLQGQITANTEAIEKLTNGVSAEEIDSVVDLINYVNDHGLEVEAMQKDIEELQEGKANKATTLDGYGITDAYSQSDIDNKLETTKNYTDTKIQEISENGFIPVQSDWEAKETTESGGINYAHIKNKPELFRCEFGQQLGTKSASGSTFLTSIGWINFQFYGNEVCFQLSQDGCTSWTDLSYLFPEESLPTDEYMWRGYAYAQDMIAIAYQKNDDITIHYYCLHCSKLNQGFQKVKTRSGGIGALDLVFYNGYYYLDLYGGNWCKIDKDCNVIQDDGKISNHATLMFLTPTSFGLWAIDGEISEPRTITLFNLDNNEQYVVDYDFPFNGSGVPRLFGGEDKLYIYFNNITICSTNGNNQWTEVTSSPQTNFIRFKNIYVTPNSRYYSTDKSNWITMDYNYLQPFGNYALYGFKDNKLYISFNGQDFQTIDGGQFYFGEQNITLTFLNIIKPYLN